MLEGDFLAKGNNFQEERTNPVNQELSDNLVNSVTQTNTPKLMNHLRKSNLKNKANKSIIDKIRQGPWRKHPLPNEGACLG